MFKIEYEHNFSEVESQLILRILQRRESIANPIIKFLLFNDFVLTKTDKKTFSIFQICVDENFFSSYL